MEIHFDVTFERDMDLLLMEEFACSTDFCKLFLSRIGHGNNFTINSVSHSVRENEGENDLVITYQIAGKKYALLIENKIDAPAMNDQCGRYLRRGEKREASGEYDSVNVFLVAPQKYRLNNIEAAKYPYFVSYEEIIEYFRQLNNTRTAFKIHQLEQAIDKQKKHPDVVKDNDSTDFFSKYIDFIKSYYPNLNCVTTKKAKGKNTDWPIFRTTKGDKDYVWIRHRINEGDVTLYVRIEKSHDNEFKKYICTNNKDIVVERNGNNQTISVKIHVPPIDNCHSFESQISAVKVAFNTVSTLDELNSEYIVNKYIPEN